MSPGYSWRCRLIGLRGAAQSKEASRRRSSRAATDQTMHVHHVSRNQSHFSSVIHGLRCISRGRRTAQKPTLGARRINHLHGNFILLAVRCRQRAGWHRPVPAYCPNRRNSRSSQITASGFDATTHLKWGCAGLMSRFCSYFATAEGTISTALRTPSTQASQRPGVDAVRGIPARGQLLRGPMFHGDPRADLDDDRFLILRDPPGAGMDEAFQHRAGIAERSVDHCPPG